MQWVRLGENCWIGRDLTAQPASVVAFLKSLDLPHVLDIVPALESVGVYVTPLFEEQWLPSIVTAIESAPSQTWDIPVCYELGEDFEEVCQQLGLTPKDLIELHSGATYTCKAVGFSPGFPYLTGLQPPLDSLFRRETPRVSVPAGSVAIAAGQCGIYPQSTPGGWWLIGRTPSKLLDLEVDRYTIAAGDNVLFRPVSASEFESLKPNPRFIESL